MLAVGRLSGHGNRIDRHLACAIRRAQWVNIVAHALLDTGDIVDKKPPWRRRRGRCASTWQCPRCDSIMCSHAINKKLASDALAADTRPTTISQRRQAAAGSQSLSPRFKRNAPLRGTFTKSSGNLTTAGGVRREGKEPTNSPLNASSKLYVTNRHRVGLAHDRASYRHQSMGNPTIVAVNKGRTQQPATALPSRIPTTPKDVDLSRSQKTSPRKVVPSESSPRKPAPATRAPNIGGSSQQQSPRRQVRIAEQERPGTTTLTKPTTQVLIEQRQAALKAQQQLVRRRMLRLCTH